MNPKQWTKLSILFSILSIVNIVAPFILSIAFIVLLGISIAGIYITKQREEKPHETYMTSKEGYGI